MTAAGFVVVCCTTLGFFGRWSWAFDLTSHFRAQYFLTLVVLALVCFVDGRRRAAAVFAAFAAINLAVIVPLYAAPETRIAGPTSPFRLMAANVFADNGRFDLVLSSVRRENPDVVLFSEVTHAWLGHLRELSEAYPHTVAKPRFDNFGIALFSRVPFRDARVVSIGPAEVPSLLAELQLPTGVVTLLGTHPMPPATAYYSRLHDEQLIELATFMRTRRPPAVLLGDLNVTPWSHRFSRLLADGALYDSMRGFGPQPSWPADLWPLRIPLDHCLHSVGVRVVDRRLGAFNGSDHYPLVVDLEVGSP